MSAPITYTWNGECHVPLPRFAKLCDAQFVIGEQYRLVVHEDRSANSHRHYFAALHEAWQNLPEEHAERFPTSEHFRKWLLIHTGYRDERSIVCASKAEAQRVAAFVRPADEYAVVSVNECAVIFWTAKSQSMRAMGKKEFGESKQAVLELAASMIGVSVPDLRKNVGNAA